MIQANLGIAYDAAHRYPDAQTALLQALEIYNRLAENNPTAFNPNVALVLNTLANHSLFCKAFTDAEQYARQSLEKDPSHLLLGPNLAAANLAAALLLQGRYADAEPIYCQNKDELKTFFLDDLHHLAEAGVIPQEREKDVARIKKLLEE